MHVDMQEYLIRKKRKKGVKYGQVSQQLKQWVHQCPPPIVMKKKRKNKDSPCFPAKSSKEGVIFKEQK